MCTMTIEKAQMQLEMEQQRIPQRIRFEVQDDFVKSLPQILSNIEEIKAWCEARTVFDRQMVLVTPDDFKEAEDRCAQYNKMITAIDNKRKDVKKAYVAPLEAFEKAIKEATSILTSAKDHLWSQVKSAEEKIKADKLNKFKTYWEETLNGEITSYRKFDSIFDQKWLNKGTKYEVAFKELDKHYEQIENDLVAIQSLNSEFEISLLEYYKDGHNLGEVIAYNNRLQSQKSARETAKAEAQAPQTQNADENGGQAQQTAQIEESEQVFELVFKVEGTQRQLKALKAFMTENGIKFGRAEWNRY